MVGKSHLGARSPANLPINRGFDVHFGFLKGGEDHYTQGSGSVGGVLTQYYLSTNLCTHLGLPLLNTQVRTTTRKGAARCMPKGRRWTCGMGTGRRT